MYKCPTKSSGAFCPTSSTRCTYVCVATESRYGPPGTVTLIIKVQISDETFSSGELLKANARYDCTKTATDWLRNII